MGDSTTVYSFAMATIKSALELIGSTTTPIMLAILGVGLVIAIFQATTQINEQSLSLVPKLVVMFLIIMFMGDTLLGGLVSYSKSLYMNIPMMVQ